MLKCVFCKELNISGSISYQGVYIRNFMRYLSFYRCRILHFTITIGVWRTKYCLSFDPSLQIQLHFKHSKTYSQTYLHISNSSQWKIFDNSLKFILIHTRQNALIIFVILYSKVSPKTILFFLARAVIDDNCIVKHVKFKEWYRKTLSSTMCSVLCYLLLEAKTTKSYRGFAVTGCHKLSVLYFGSRSAVFKDWSL